MHSDFSCGVSTPFFVLVFLKFHLTTVLNGKQIIIVFYKTQSKLSQSNKRLIISQVKKSRACTRIKCVNNEIDTHKLDVGCVCESVSFYEHYKNKTEQICQQCFFIANVRPFCTFCDMFQFMHIALNMCGTAQKSKKKNKMKTIYIVVFNSLSQMKRFHTISFIRMRRARLWNLFSTRVASFLFLACHPIAARTHTVHLRHDRF